MSRHVHTGDTEAREPLLTCDYLEPREPDQNTVWKGQDGWGLEAEEVGVRDAGGAKHSDAARAKTARAAPSRPSKTVREAGASLGGEEGEKRTGATHSSSCQKGLMCYQ